MGCVEGVVQGVVGSACAPKRCGVILLEGL